MKLCIGRQKITFCNKQNVVKNNLFHLLKNRDYKVCLLHLSNPLMIFTNSKFSFLILLLFFCAQLSAQQTNKATLQNDYIERYKELAVRQMLQYGIPASITLGQGILETDAGTSELAVGSNNHFGIKCHLDWTGETYIHDDDLKNECFRKYRSIELSYVDHSLFILSRNWYRPLFDLKTTDYKGWARGLKKAGYATDKNYAEKLIRIIEENDLTVYDVITDVTSLPERHPRSSNTSVADVNASPISSETLSEYEIQLNNERKFIIVKKGDNIPKLAKQFDMKEWQFYKYNDLANGAKLKAGDIVYLQPKRNHASKDYHIVKRGEDMHTISQIYCVKLTKLYENNLMSYGSQPKEGEKIYLKRKKA